MITIQMQRVQGDYGFEAVDALGHKVHTDTSEENGGSNYGARPMQLLLSALGGCSAIDVVSILKKQRQPIRDFKVTIQGEREKDAVPSLWTSVHLRFDLSGAIEPEKAWRACELSVNKYCSVAETLRRAGAQITWDVEVHP